MKIKAVIELEIELDRIPDGITLSSTIRKHIEKMSGVKDRDGFVKTNLNIQRIKYPVSEDK